MKTAYAKRTASLVILLAAIMVLRQANGTEIQAAPVMVEAEHVVVYKHAADNAYFPSLLADPDTGYLYTTFTVKPMSTHHYIPGSRRVRMESRDQGLNWQEIESIPGSARSVRPRQFSLPDGSLVRFGDRGFRWLPKERLPEFEGRHRITPGSERQGPSPEHFAVCFGGYVERSEDGGDTWQRAPIPELDTYATRSSPWSHAQLPDGTVLCAYRIQHGEDVEPQVYVALTGDGKHVDMVHVMGEEPGGPLRFTEETLVHVTGRGVVWLLTRVHGEGDYMWQAVSRDGGRTWASRPTEITIGRSPASGLVELEDGRLLLLFGYRREPFGIRGLLSADEGLTWQMDRPIVLRDDGYGRDLGYPRALNLPDGSVLTIYYHDTGDRIRHIVCTRFTVPERE